MSDRADAADPAGPGAPPPGAGVGVASAVGVAFAVQLGVSFAVFSPPVLAPAAHGPIGVSAASVGIFTSITYLFAATAALTSAGPVARFGALRVSQACLLLAAAGMALAATGELPLVILGAALMGMGYGPVTPASAIILISSLPSRMRSLGFSIKQTGVPVAAGVGGLVLPALVVSTGWRVAALLVAGACVAIAIACQWLRPRMDTALAGRAPPGSGSPLASLRLVVASAPLRRLAIGSFIFAGIQMCVVTYLVVFLVGEGGFELASAGLAMTVAMAGGVLGRLGWGWVADNWISPSRTLALVSLLMGLSSIGFTLVGPAWPLAMVMVLAFVAGASAIAWNGVYLAEIAYRAPEGMATAATAGTMFCTYAGVMLWPAVFFAVHAASGGYGAAFAMVGLLGLGGALLFVREER